MTKVVEVVKVEDVVWLLNNYLKREKHEYFLDQAIDIILNEIKNSVELRMPKYKVELSTLVKGHIIDGI